MFSGALLEKCRFSACAFDFSRLNDVLARGCSFENCTFSGASLFVTAFENCRVSGCSFAGADLTRLGRARRHTSNTVCSIIVRSKSRIFPASVCAVRALRKRTSKKADLSGCDLTETVFRNAQLKECDLRRAKFSRTDIRFAKNAEKQRSIWRARCISQDCLAPSSTKKPAKNFVKKRVLFCQPPYGVHRAYKRV